MKIILRLMCVVAILTGAVCASLGRIMQGAAGIIAPEYKASFDNVYGRLLQDQLLATVGLEAVFVTKEGRILRNDDLTPTVLTTQQAYSWESLPRGFVPLFLGEKSRMPSGAAEQREELANALKSIPTEPKTKTKE